MPSRLLATSSCAGVAITPRRSRISGPAPGGCLAPGLCWLSDDERELYEHERNQRAFGIGPTSPTPGAASSAAHRLLRSVIDDGELLDDLADLENWLEAFHDRQSSSSTMPGLPVVARATICGPFGRGHPPRTRCCASIGLRDCRRGVPGIRTAVESGQRLSSAPTSELRPEQLICVLKQITGNFPAVFGPFGYALSRDSP